jgi:putative spermidine/putrescine transport system permease protein
MRLGETILAGSAVAIALVVLVIQLAPLVIICAVSLSGASTFDLPTGSASLRWYRVLLGTEGLWIAFRTSLGIAAIATMSSLVLGTLCGVALFGARFRGRELLLSVLLSPLMLPGIVLGIAMLRGFNLYGIALTYIELVLAHIVLTLPYIVRIVMTALDQFDFTLIDAARTLGLSYASAVRKVLVPNIMPAMITASLFAFLASFDNYAVSMFLVDARTTTLPIKMLEFIEESVDPRLAALSTILIAMSLTVVVFAGRLVGLRRTSELK